MPTDKKKPMRMILALSALVASAAIASEAPGGVIKPAHNDITNVASLQRGARNFVNYCMGCHSARYVRYSRLGADLGLSEQQVIENLMFSGERIHDTMRTSMPLAARCPASSKSLSRWQTSSSAADSVADPLAVT